jgi:hypothetical protein
VKTGCLRQVRHQELHLVRQDAAVAQDEVFPQAGHVGRVQQRHVGLLGRAVALAVVARAAGRHHVHPQIASVLPQGNDVLARQLFFVEVPAAVAAQAAIARKQFAVGERGSQVKGVDAWNALGADDGVDGDDGLATRDRVVSTVKHRHLGAHFPAHFIRRVMQHGFFEADPGLGQSLRRQLQDLQDPPPC